MQPMEVARTLRADTQTHYNCCQSVIIPFCERMGLTREKAYREAQTYG